MSEEDAPRSNTCSMKNGVLVALALQQAGLVLMIRYSKMREDTHYVSSTAVVSAELVKIALNMSLGFWVLAAQPQSSSLLSALKALCKLVFRLDSSVEMAVPALLYVVQNNLLFVALANLSVPVYQVTNQGKLLTTALCSRLLLGRKLSWVQYGSLVVLAVGVALVQLSGRDASKDTKTEQELEAARSQLIGFGAVIISCFTSGFSGVYFEKVLKNSNSNRKKEQPEDDGSKASAVYVRNTQLAIWSVLLGLFPVLTKDLKAIQTQGGFFQGYNVTVLGVIVCQALTGLLVGLVMKYADAVLKGFSTSVAVILATVVSFFVWNVTLDMYFLVGACMVMAAVRLYSSKDVCQSIIHGSTFRIAKIMLVSVLCLIVVFRSITVNNYDDYINMVEKGTYPANSLLTAKPGRLR